MNSGGERNIAVGNNVRGGLTMKYETSRNIYGFS